MRSHVGHYYELFLGRDVDKKIRKMVIISAIIGFCFHLLIWALVQTEKYTFSDENMEMFNSPLSSLYTPFSILLAYEVYQLIRTIPESFSSSVGKQYEIATLLVVRDILKRLSNIEFQDGWKIDNDLGFLIIECVTFLVLFYTSLVYQRISNETRCDILARCFSNASFCSKRNCRCCNNSNILD